MMLPAWHSIDYTSCETDWNITAIQDCGQPGFTYIGIVGALEQNEISVSVFHSSFFLIATFLFVLS